MQDPYRTEKKIDGSSLVNTGVGVVVLMIGLGLALWIVSMLGQMIGGEGPLPVVERLAESGGSGDVMPYPGGQVDVEAFTTVAGYLVSILLLSIGAGIAKAVIGAGAKIMNPDYKKVLGELKKELKKGGPSR